MNTTAQFIPYRQTGFFSSMVADYISEAPRLQPFYMHPVSLDGIKASIEQRKSFATDRALLVDILNEQYETTPLTEKQKKYIHQLSSDNTFTICTAHQPNIFTGPLYFIYKILHAVKLAEELQAVIPENNFVPVYYMGSEDADLDELGHVFINGEKYEWATKQTGAVGRMIVDKTLVQLIEAISGQLLVLPFGAEITGLMKDCYQPGVTIEQATFKLVNALFAEYGVLILLPDSAEVKRRFAPVIEKELMEGFSHPAVQQTVSQFPEEYKAQASGRAINLFYLVDGKRERIEQAGDDFLIVNMQLKFSKAAMLQELQEHPERFSPNVILRPVLQETILPDIAFIGGGGEIAYWLELKKVFEAVQVPYPMLIVRNSFMIVNTVMQAATKKLQLEYAGLFATELELVNHLVKRDSTIQLSLEEEKENMIALYDQIKKIAGDIDTSLKTHTNALQTQALKKITALEKKMFRAQKRKFEAQQRQLEKLKKELFPNNSLQERVDNLMPFYASHGKEFIKMIYSHSKGLQQEFGVILE
ncbi:bacillithiol biosynthesis cysteine-adding enzyme BshC [Ferruginibacter paludis]|uniref:bacillithiol biosynthesis cysteine-adding enzyme BshC n=1 Tax=Ferruginibacter paludis TaxID=1310417 RepID=UPI0025B35FCA|nr:bacillithiol biosynthesis cysteine-adding enzyme BshC [Ferruginibacter paludis]MDN3658033.1 bacillithiol biosynthesis cysteine-adding enzyme BshC [Ferruginibacter paludis]